MTKAEFKKLEKLFKKGWAELSVTGARVKPKYMFPFMCGCPACEIAVGAMTRKYLYRCNYCPITRWQRKADGIAHPCESDMKTYGLWISTRNKDKRKAAAKEIAKLKWEYQDEYQDVHLGVDFEKLGK